MEHCDETPGLPHYDYQIKPNCDEIRRVLFEGRREMSSSTFKELLRKLEYCVSKYETD